jgi:TPR repeat protein
VRILLAAVTAFMLCATPVVAGGFEDAEAAYKAGDYQKALRLYKPLAEQGHAGAQFGLAITYLEGRGVPEASEYGCNPRGAATRCPYTGRETSIGS